VDEVLLITGSSGIAAAVARMWAAENPVFFFGVNENECRSLAGELHGAGFAVGDLREEAAVRRGVSACLERFGRIDALMKLVLMVKTNFYYGERHACPRLLLDFIVDDQSLSIRSQSRS
jgi:hypothetical protein